RISSQLVLPFTSSQPSISSVSSALNPPIARSSTNFFLPRCVDLDALSIALNTTKELRFSAILLRLKQKAHPPTFHASCERKAPASTGREQVSQMPAIRCQMAPWNAPQTLAILQRALPELSCVKGRFQCVNVCKSRVGNPYSVADGQ